MALNCNWLGGRCARDQDGGRGVKVVRYEPVRAVGFFLFAGGWIVVYFANGGIITGNLMIILGADILMAGLLAKNLERANQA